MEFKPEIQEKPKNWLIESIIVAVFCCQVLGVVGLFYAARVEPKYESGDYEKAHRYAQNAKNFTMAGFFVGLAIYFFVVLLQIIEGSFNFLFR